MASAEEFAQLKKVVQELRRGQLDLILRFEVEPLRESYSAFAKMFLLHVRLFLARRLKIA